MTPKTALENPKQYTEDNPAYKGRYEVAWPAHEKPLRYGYHYIVSRIGTGYVVRVFHPDKKTLVSVESYSTADLTLLHGPAEQYWDDGSIRHQGVWQFGRKHGLWLECEPGRGKSWCGMYVNDRKDGLWTQMDSSGLVESTQIWQDGLRHGKHLVYDGSGQKINEALYRSDTLVTELFPMPRQRPPVLSPCSAPDAGDPHTCTQRLLAQTITSSLKYPQSASAAGIEGTAIIQWDVMPDGSMANLRVPYALCDAIEQECRRVAAALPGWVAGRIGDAPAVMSMTVPVKFSR